MATGKAKQAVTKAQDGLDTTVTIRIERAIVRKLDATARKVARSRSNLIRLALEDFVRKNA